MAAQGLSEGFNRRAQKQEQNKMFTAQSKATENLLKSYLPKEQVSAILAVDPNETPAARHARLTGTIENFVVENKLKQFQAAQAQAEKDQTALSQAMNQFLPQNGAAASFDPRRFLSTYFSQGGSPQSLDRVDQALKMLAAPAEKQGRVMTQDQIQKLKEGGYDAKATPLQDGTFMVTEVSPFSPPAKTEVNFGEDAYAKEVGKLAGEQHMKEYAAAVDAPVNIAKLDEVVGILKQGDATTGLGAELINNLNRVRSGFMADKKAGKSVSDTQVLDALLGSDVFPQIGALGIGARGLDTPSERDYLRQVMTGTINLDKDSLVRMAEIRRNIQVRALDKFKKSLEKGTYKKFFDVTGNPVPDLSILDAAKESSAPEGVDPKLWSVMTPEEKKLWQN